MMKFMKLPAVGLALALALPLPSAADEVPLEQVPPAVRTTIEREVGNGRIQEIERETREGRRVYEVEFIRDNREQEIHITEDGTVVKRDR